ncbi:CopG family transcriptional regulator [Lawsonia intracellularis]|uniref:CopG family transcriptional regulator n=1 Tax=Lawsonia intracellularis (strain PHE/MN1-00) TaxID=363253 RepID=Q1MP04_LAWIP|nr:CopG family transcriptional regulator [Lawsonia intracellularis]AGC50648.1 hypothetical protein LAW_20001 [Lawsonia intracellularis N343]KAA0204209.1 CopG family transcriptional regulator [Lawsonia intracellularis]MBZ3893294.1 CopG family transcriptional regulator [Lawsonia intracellularis]OMQ02001.1 CopG family transcriptional regulator [Lawsonia intracellularis]RBN31862.1 CopG family transcriptional regulator [Lawsonia intracellularis]
MKTLSNTTSVKLEDSVKTRIKNLAAIRKRTPHSIMVEAIEEYIDKAEKREAFRQEGINVYNDYLNNGLHLPVEEAIAWLNELANGNYVEPPKCHL